MNNQPAFPSSNEVKVGNCISSGHMGMTLRDYFAAKAMQAFCSDSDWRQDMMPGETAKAAYHQADAMLKAREV
jgi:hypothetical protein